MPRSALRLVLEPPLENALRICARRVSTNDNESLDSSVSGVILERDAKDESSGRGDFGVNRKGGNPPALCGDPARGDDAPKYCESDGNDFTYWISWPRYGSAAPPDTSAAAACCACWRSCIFSSSCDAALASASMFTSEAP